LYYIQIDFKAGIIGAVVLTAYNNETYRIDDIDENSDPTSTFEKNDGSKISYTQYYKEVRISYLNRVIFCGIFI